jgi:hypothetical protein
MRCGKRLECCSQNYAIRKWPGNPDRRQICGVADLHESNPRTILDAQVIARTKAGRRQLFDSRGHTASHHQSPLEAGVAGCRAMLEVLPATSD